MKLLNLVSNSLNTLMYRLVFLHISSSSATVTHAFTRKVVLQVLGTDRLYEIFLP